MTRSACLIRLEERITAGSVRAKPTAAHIGLSQNWPTTGKGTSNRSEPPIAGAAPTTASIAIELEALFDGAGLIDVHHDTMAFAT